MNNMIERNMKEQKEHNMKNDHNPFVANRKPVLQLKVEVSHLLPFVQCASWRTQSFSRKLHLQQPRRREKQPPPAGLEPAIGLEVRRLVH